MSELGTKRPFILPVLLAAVAIALSLYNFFADRIPNSSVPQVSVQSALLNTIEKDHVIRAGYGVFPPFTQEDARTGKVSGASVAIIEEIGRQLGVRVEWHRFNWNTMGADLKRGAFDVVADPIFETPQRGREFTFTEPYSYFGIGVGVVRKGDTRFKRFEDINKASVTVVVGQGYAEESLVKARAPLANLVSVPATQDTTTPINAVLTGRADIAVSNIDDATRFVAAHPNNLELLWVDAPPAFVPAGFALRLGDSAGADFLNVSIRNLRGAGILSAIASRYGKSVNLSEPTVQR